MPRGRPKKVAAKQITKAVTLREKIVFTPEMKEEIHKTFAPNGTDAELKLFFGIADSFGLNPFKREVHFIKYGNSAANIVVGYEVYLKRAEATGMLDGWEVEIVGKGVDRKAKVTIHRKDWESPFVWEVDASEFDKKQSSWKAMPNFMLKKVAIGQGMRLAFPNELGGMPYLPEELPQTMGGGSTEALSQAKDITPEVESPPPPPAQEAESVAEQAKFEQAKAEAAAREAAKKKPEATAEAEPTPDPFSGEPAVDSPLLDAQTITNIGAAFSRFEITIANIETALGSKQDTWTEDTKAMLLKYFKDIEAGKVDPADFKK